MGKHSKGHRYGSLKNQISRRLNAKTAFGDSKHADKRVPVSDGRYLSDTKIYSKSTLTTYIKQCNYFAEWCKENHGCRTLDECRQYANDWIQSRVDAGLSAYTIKLEVSALSKLYDCKSEKLISVAVPSRLRSNITRSRGEKSMDRHFSESKNAELVEFCRCTGLRRSELESLRGEQLRKVDGNYYLEIKGKGGRTRLAPIVGNSRLVIEKCRESGSERVWGRVSKAADIHGYRADYAKRIYELHARPMWSLSEKQRYYCRGDMKGYVFDRAAMLEASRALGHNRISVVAEHYLI